VNGCAIEVRWRRFKEGAVAIVKEP